MIIELHPSFKRAYKKRIANNPKLVSRVEERIKLFRLNPDDPVLQDHKLKGKKKYFRSFSISGNIRIVYFPASDVKVIFLDIGSHPQVY